MRGRTVKIGFQFPKEASILRKELHQKIMEQNVAAANIGEHDMLEVEFDLDKPAEGEMGTMAETDNDSTSRTFDRDKLAVALQYERKKEISSARVSAKGQGPHRRADHQAGTRA